MKNLINATLLQLFYTKSSLEIFSDRLEISVISPASFSIQGEGFYGHLKVFRVADISPENGVAGTLGLDLSESKDFDFSGFSTYSSAITISNNDDDFPASVTELVCHDELEKEDQRQVSSLEVWLAGAKRITISPGDSGQEIMVILPL